jgi:molybdate transport system substrate-binding protein
MFKRISTVLLVFLLILVSVGCSNHETSSSQERTSSAPAKKEIMISAAASLTDVLNEMKTSFEKEHSDVSVTYNFGGSGKLAQQIEQGAPTDLFLSASKKDMDKLQEKGLVTKGTRIDFAKNELVLIVPKDSALHIDSFEKVTPEQIKQLAVGEPESVPAGRYTKETFEKIGLWEKVKDKLVLGKDVRQVLTYVESGNADAGVVYESDAIVSQKVKVLATAKSEWHKPIVYPGAVTTNAENKEEAKMFLDYLTSEKGKEVFKKYGFK